VQWRTSPPALRASIYQKLQEAQAALTNLEFEEAPAPSLLPEKKTVINPDGLVALRRLEEARQQAVSSPIASLLPPPSTISQPPSTRSSAARITPSPILRTPTTQPATIVRHNVPANLIGEIQLYRDIYSDGSTSGLRLQETDGTYRDTTMEEVWQLVRSRAQSQ